MDWTKLSVGILTSAKFGKAGDDGRMLYIAMLCLHAKHGEYGRIPSSHSNPDSLAFEAVACFRQWSEERIQDALGATVAAGLIRVLEDGEVELVGYGDEHMPMCTRCRKPNPAPRKSRCPRCRGEESAASAQNDADTVHAERNHSADTAQNEICKRSVDRHDRHDGQDRHADSPSGDGGDGDGCPGSDQTLLLWQALKETPWLDKLGDADRPRRLLTEARRLHRDGLDPSGLQMLVLLSSKGRKPGALLASWLERVKWREVIAEQVAADKQKSLGPKFGRGSTQSIGDVLGITGRAS